MNRSSTRLQIIARAASLALAAVLLAPAALHADVLPLRIADPTANEKLASGDFFGLGESNVKRSLTLAAEKRWGNDYMHARYYSPNLGRFMSVDPVGGSIGSSQSWNRYSYVRNNPLKFVDPNGEFAILAALKIYAAKIALNAGVGAVAKVGTDFTINMMKNPGNLVERAQAAHSQMDYGKSAKDGAIIGAANGLVNGWGGVAAATALSYQDSQGSGNTSGESAEDAGLTALAATGGALTGQVLKAKAAQAGVGLATSGEPTGLLSTVSIIVVGGVVEAGLESLGTDLPEIIAPKNEPDINPPNPTPIEN